MSLTCEDGTGVIGADSYASLAQASSYWSYRTQSPNASLWSGSTDAVREGALREATAYLDSTWNSLFIGSKKTSTQGLLWPRVSRTVLNPADYDTIADMEAAQAETDQPLIGKDGLALSALPIQIIQATIELSARAITNPLAKDKGEEGWLKRRKVGPIEREWGSGGILGGSYGFVDDLLAQICIGKRNASWAWA